MGIAAAFHILSWYLPPLARTNHSCGVTKVEHLSELSHSQQSPKMTQLQTVAIALANVCEEVPSIPDSLELLQLDGCSLRPPKSVSKRSSHKGSQ